MIVRIEKLVPHYELTIEDKGLHLYDFVKEGIRIRKFLNATLFVNRKRTKCGLLEWSPENERERYVAIYDTQYVEGERDIYVEDQMDEVIEMIKEIIQKKCPNYFLEPEDGIVVSF